MTTRKDPRKQKNKATKQKALKIQLNQKHYSNFRNNRFSFTKMTSRGYIKRFSVAIVLLISLLAASNAICSVDGDNSPIDCMNGLWNEDICGCECIPPFCPDLNGQCGQCFWVTQFYHFLLFEPPEIY